MSASPRLDALLDRAAATWPERPAVIDPDRGRASYAVLRSAAGRMAARLRGIGVGPGDRVGICAPKSVGVIAGIFGILEAGGAYVPVDPTAPAARSAFIFDDCAVKALLVHRTLLAGLAGQLQHADTEIVEPFEVPGTEAHDLVIVRTRPRAGAPAYVPGPPDLAYILYTSGSTGKPKGVMHSHATALAFVDWCAGEFAPVPQDVFSSHAPFHFDLSIFDLYVPVMHGAAIVVIGEERGKAPLKLAQLIVDERITVWYSTPSILRLLVEFGKIDQADCSSLRLVLFAGEVFPPKQQRALRQRWPHPVYYNLYGPTETNVCTFERVNTIPPDDATGPFSIGRVCSGDRARVVDADGRDLPAGQEGELVVAGGSVMLDYWNLPENNARAFITDGNGERWYRTGDLAIDPGDGAYLFRGRRDRMVKRRGYRVELGEIEAALYRHAHVTEAAVVALPDPDSGVIIKAFMNWTGPKKPSLIELKGYASKALPAYMIPDRFSVLAALPKTSTDKIDYQRLKEMD
ncbi:MAG: amino acid adenylation domain-containing protein [Gammaproteobacteria bacterium]